MTCSFRGDFEICRMLCDSVNRFVPNTIEHWLIVPDADQAMFESLATARCKIITESSVMPRWFVKMPMPAPRWRGLLHLPRRDIYLTPFSLPVRGWIFQQILKIAATTAAKSNIVVHIDSDAAFIRPLKLERLVHGGQIHLFRDPHRVDLPYHQRWQQAAGKLLGLPPSDYYGAEYIEPLVVWDRAVALGMINRIENISRRNWMISLARTPHFSEYVLYGVYADQVLGLEAAKLYPDANPLCHSRWGGDPFINADDEAAFISAIKPQHLSCNIQSTIETPLSKRVHLFERAVSFAAAQDSHLSSQSPLSPR
jgi:hypothetical protein